MTGGQVCKSPQTRRDGHPELFLHARDHVEIRHRGFHHDDVGPLVEIQGDLAQRFFDVRGVHLVRAAIAERGGGVRRIAERPVKRRAVLGRVRHNRDLRVAGVIEHLAYPPDAPVHHVRRRDDVRSRRRM